MKVLLHVCCGVCASSVAERIMCEGHTVTGFFYNPNIHPVDEYQKRLEVAVRASKELGFELIEGPYDRENWFERMKGKEYAPEGGARCRECYAMRLEKTWQMCRKGNYDLFATTLSVSPHKDAVVINEIGRALGGEKFICADFKKKNGFQRANELAKEWGVYRQHYCGCIYSLERSIAEERAKTGKKG